MKKYIALAFVAIGLGTTVYAFNSTENNSSKCNCSQTEVCSCETACECSSCKN